MGIRFIIRSYNIHNPTYLNSGIINTRRYNDKGVLSEADTLSVNNAFHDVKEWLKPCINSGSIDLRKLSESRYMGLELGRGIVSSCLRILPNTNASLQAPFQIVADLALKLVRSIYFFQKDSYLTQNLQCVFFSETTYQSSVFIEYFLKLGVNCPFLYVNDGPLVLNSTHL